MVVFKILDLAMLLFYWVALRWFCKVKMFWIFFQTVFPTFFYFFFLIRVILKPSICTLGSIISLGTQSQLNNRMNSSVQKPHFTQQVLQSVLCLVVTIKIKRPWSRIFQRDPRPPSLPFPSLPLRFLTLDFTKFSQG